MWGSFDPKRAAREAVGAARQAVGDRLESATLYGSAAMGSFHPGRSDLNVAFVFASLEGELLDALRPAHRAWRKRRIVRPLLLTRTILETSRDTFPLEYLLIRSHHENLHGPDPFSAIAVERSALRLQVERTLRTQSLALAWSYLDTAGTPGGARHWAGRAGTAIAASACGLLHLNGAEIPATRHELAAMAAAAFGIPEDSLLRVLLPPGERPAVETTALFGSARDVVQRLLEAAERMDGPSERKS